MVNRVEVRCRKLLLPAPRALRALCTGPRCLTQGLGIKMGPRNKNGASESKDRTFAQGLGIKTRNNAGPRKENTGPRTKISAVPSSLPYNKGPRNENTGQMRDYTGPRNKNQNKTLPFPSLYLLLCLISGPKTKPNNPNPRIVPCSMPYTRGLGPNCTMFYALYQRENRTNEGPQAKLYHVLCLIPDKSSCCTMFYALYQTICTMFYALYQTNQGQQTRLYHVLCLISVPNPTTISIVPSSMLVKLVVAGV